MNGEPADWVWASFLFGVSVAEKVNGIGFGKTPADEMEQLLIGIAYRGETLLPSGAEFRQAAKQKGLPTDGVDIEGIRRDNQQVTETIARIILERLSQTRGTDE